MNNAYTRVDEAALRDYTAAILRGAGLSAEGARIAAVVLVTSDVRGIESHGVARLPQYVALIDAGVPRLPVVATLPIRDEKLSRMGKVATTGSPGTGKAISLAAMLFMPCVPA